MSAFNHTFVGVRPRINDYSRLIFMGVIIYPCYCLLVIRPANFKISNSLLVDGDVEISDEC